MIEEYQKNHPDKNIEELKIELNKDENEDFDILRFYEDFSDISLDIFKKLM